MTVLFVAANGGHLAQLVELAPRLPLPGADTGLWATPADAQSASLLQGREHLALPPVPERGLAAIAALLPTAARVLRRVRPTAVVSTGSGVALAFLPLSAAAGIPTYFIESATFAHSASVTGAVLQRVPRVRRYTQHPERVDRHWRHGGSVFDGCEVTLGSADRPIRRAVVTLGSDRWRFRPLVERARQLLGDDVEVRWQVGPTEVADLGIDAVPYVPAAELARWIAAADVVVSHAGCGAALTALRAGKLPVLVARDPARDEVVDGHQLAFARTLDQRGLAIGREVAALTAADLATAAGATVTWRPAGTFDLEAPPARR